jgi:hypothetical protein
MRDMGTVDEVAPPAPPEPPEGLIDVDELLESIELASTLEGLELLRADMRRVPKGLDRDRIISAAKRRADQIRAEQEPPAGDPQIVQAEEGTV